MYKMEGGRKDDLIRKKALCLQLDARIGESVRRKDKRNGPDSDEEKYSAMTIKKAEKAKKCKRPKILPKHLKFIRNSMQSLVNLRSFLRWRWQ